MVALDVVVAVALLPVLSPGGALLAQVSTAMRIAYAAVFAVAAGSLLDPADEARFLATWTAALLIFGVHLGFVGVAALRTRTIPLWICVLVMVAGVGYIVDSLITILVPSSVFSIGQFTFVGEVVLLLWLIIRGGRPRVRHGVTPQASVPHGG